MSSKSLSACKLIFKYFSGIVVCRLNKEFFDHLQLELGKLRFAVSKTKVCCQNALVGVT